MAIIISATLLRAGNASGYFNQKCFPNLSANLPVSNEIIFVSHLVTYKTRMFQVQCSQ